MHISFPVGGLVALWVTSCGGQVLPDQHATVDTVTPLKEAIAGEMEAAAQDGFDGGVMVVRDANIIFEKAYGFANREKKIPNRIDTIYAIGSAPIDFTKAAIFLLRDRGKLELEDSLGKFFHDVPADKRDITIRELMTGQSGLPDFHDLPGDKDPDHTWIDRDEAVRRMFAQRLLFDPGSGEQHSHSAWGLLAAIVEVASGQSYPQFTREHVFQPLGMRDTGFFGEPLPEARTAVGYGHRKAGEPNSSPHWGPTSWLVMGSGGQVSTLRDMFRFAVGMRAGTVLTAQSTRDYLNLSGGLSQDGDMYGFEFMHSADPRAMFLLISNSIDSTAKREQFDRLGRSIHQQLVPRQSPGRFSLGVEMGVTADGSVVVVGVVPGGAAERDGLRVDDRLIKANGTAVGDSPLDVLRPYLATGDPIIFELRREGVLTTVTVHPSPR